MSSTRIYPDLSSTCLLLLSTILTSIHPTTSVYLPGSEISFLRYPKWDGCSNSSISFDFRTTQPKGLLLYVDDGGRSDFLQIFYVPGRVHAVIKLTDVRYMSVAVTVHEGRWHRVVLQRSGAQTTLTVDGVTDSSYSFGVNQIFGLGPQNNSYVHFGGIPLEFGNNLQSLSLPSVFFHERFNGHIRNVLYGNCSCARLKVEFLIGAGYVDQSGDLCNQYSCRKGCLCLSLDADTTCDCVDQHCIAGIENHFKLPFDAVDGKVLINSTDFNASIHGGIFLERGVFGKALVLGGRGGRVVISGAECLAERDPCQMGFTLALWMNFSNICTQETILLSNTNTSLRVTGIVVTYHDQKLTARLRRGNLIWHVLVDNILTGWWYHLALTWNMNNGLTMYINGEQRDSDSQPTAVSSHSRTSSSHAGMANELILGCPLNGSMNCDQCEVLIDEFDFRSKHRTASQVKEAKESGPLFCYQISMDFRDGFIDAGHGVSVLTNGGSIVPGKIGKAFQFSSPDDYVDGGDVEHTCLSDLVLCKDGVTISMWIQLTPLAEEFHFFSSGVRGIEIFYEEGVLVAVAQEGQRQWIATCKDLAKSRWYFIEVTWSFHSGLQLYIDLKMTSQSTVSFSAEQTSTGAKLYIGRSNSNSSESRPHSVSREPVALVDQVQVCYGGRDRLEAIDIIDRGRPVKYSMDMDAIVDNSLELHHSPRRATVFGRPHNVPGKINNATRLDGNEQYIDLGHHGDSCLGYLLRCRHGFTGSMWAKFRASENGMFYLSTGGGVKIYFKFNNLVFSFSIPGKRWEIQIAAPPTDVWQFIEFSWSLDVGLKVYLNSLLAGEDRVPVPVPGDMGKMPASSSVRIGYANKWDAIGIPLKYGNFLVDETEFWYSDRDTLLAFGHITRENITHVMIAFDGSR